MIDDSTKIAKLSEESREVYKRLIMNVDTNIDISRVILDKENQDKISKFLAENEMKDTFVRYNLKPMNRILMYGASGTGKTFLTKALSNKLEYTMLYIDISQSLSDGSIAQNISDIFKLANELGRCIIFLDECDAVAWTRDSGQSDTGTIRRAQNSLFQQLDQLQPGNIFVSATNMLHRLDPAFVRRFDMKMLFQRPKTSLMDCIPRFLFNDFKLIDDVSKEVRTIVDKRCMESSRLSYYEYQGIVERGMKRALMNKTLSVHTKDLYADLAEAESIRFRFNTSILEDEEESINRLNS